MVKKVNIGVIGIQGAITEHIFSMKRALNKYALEGNVFLIKSKDDLKDIDALILPGGESTTISKNLFHSGMQNKILNLIEKDNLPIMGTCAGCVLLAKQLNREDVDVKLLKLMDMKVKRNAFGRQKESFEKEIKIEKLSNLYNAVFIRAPVIEKIWGNCESIASIDGKIVMAKQNNRLALSFHPELTDDLRIHKIFLDMI
jgi:5'-phosphate synthase pdxT subunit